VDGSPFPAPFHDILPQSCLENLSRRNGFVHQPCALLEHASGAQGIVSHLAVPHVLVTRKPDGSAVSLQFTVKIRTAEAVEIGGPCQVYGVCPVSRANPDAVHDNQEEGAFSAGKGTQFIEF